VKSLQAWFGRSILLRFEHTFGSRHLITRDCGKTRLRRCSYSPSRPHVRGAFHDWDSTASNRQGGFVLAPRLIVVKWRLIEIQNQGIVSEHQEDEIPKTEQDDPENFHALLDNSS
jgi:hypothetical protein